MTGRTDSGAGAYSQGSGEPGGAGAAPGSDLVFGFFFRIESVCQGAEPRVLIGWARL